MWCSKCKLSSIHVKNFDRIICTRGHLLCTGCFEGNLCPICGSKIKQKIKMFVDGTPKIYFLPIDSDNESDYHQGFSESQQGTSREQTGSEVPEFSDNDTIENRSSILQFSSDFENDVRSFRLEPRDLKPEVIDLHPPVKNFLSEDEDDRSSTKLVPNAPSLKGSQSSVCIGPSRSISRFKTKSEENIKVNSNNSGTISQNEEVFDKPPPITPDPKELFLKTFYSGKNEDDSFDARSHYYKTMAELNAFRDFIVQSRMAQGDGNRRTTSMLDATSSETISRSANLKPHSQKIVEHLKEFRRETRYKPPKKFKVYKNYSETSGNMIITSSNSSQSTITNSEMDRSPRSPVIVSSEEKQESDKERIQINHVVSQEKEVKKPVVLQIVDPRAIEIREKLKAEIYSNFENNSTVTSNNESFIENCTGSGSCTVNPTLSNLKSLLKSDGNKCLESPGSRRSSSGNTQKTVSIQPRVQIMHPFSFFSTSCEQKRIEELQRIKTEIREKLKNEVYGIFKDADKNENHEEENVNCFIEDNDNYLVNCKVPDTALSDSYTKLNANLNRLKLGQPTNKTSQSELHIHLMNEETDNETEETVESLDQTVRESAQYDFLFDSTIPSTAASTACRACAYYGSTDFYKFGPPLKLVPIQTNLNRDDNLPSSFPKSITEINIDRSPVKCPITSCEQFIFISSFSKHIKIDHQKILIESITPGRWRNMFLDPRIDRIGVNKCQMFYLIADKITGLGNSKYKDYLPVMVMSTRVDAQQLFDRNVKYSSSNSHFLMIWLTGLCVSEVPVYYSLTVWSDYQNPNRPKKFKHPTTCHLVHSKKLYSIRNDQDHMTLYKSGSALIISEEQCKLLSDYGRNMIELQIFVH